MLLPHLLVEVSQCLSCPVPDLKVPEPIPFLGLSFTKQNFLNLQYKPSVSTPKPVGTEKSIKREREKKSFCVSDSSTAVQKTTQLIPQ